MPALPAQVSATSKGRPSDGGPLTCRFPQVYDLVLGPLRKGSHSTGHLLFYVKLVHILLNSLSLAMLIRDIRSTF